MEASDCKRLKRVSTDSDGRVTEDAQQKRWKEKRGLLARLEEGEKVDKEVGS